MNSATTIRKTLAGLAATVALGVVGLAVIVPALAESGVQCENGTSSRCACPNECNKPGDKSVGSCDLPATCGGGAATNTSTPAVPFKTYKLSNPLGVESIPELVGRAVTIFTGISGSLALLMFVYGGILLLTSGGNEERIKDGKNIFLWSSVGLVIIFGSYIFLRLLFNAVGAAN